MPHYDFDRELLGKKKESSIGEQAQTVGVPTRRKAMNLKSYDAMGEKVTIDVENSVYGDSSKIPHHYPVPPQRGHKLHTEEDAIAPHRRHMTAAANEVLYFSAKPGCEMQFGFEHSVTAHGVARRQVPKTTKSKASKEHPQAGTTMPSGSIPSRSVDSRLSDRTVSMESSMSRKPVARHKRQRSKSDSERASKAPRSKTSTHTVPTGDPETPLVIKPKKTHPWVEIRSDEVHWRGQPGRLPQSSTSAKEGARSRVIAAVEYKRIGILWRWIKCLERWANHEPVVWSDDEGTRPSTNLKGELPPGAVKILQQSGLYAIIYRVRHIIVMDHVSTLHLKFNLRITAHTTAVELWEQNLAGVEVEVGGIRHDVSMGDWNLQRIRVGWMDEARNEIPDDAADVIMEDA